MSTIRFDGRSAIVTGAGHGLGRSYARALAGRGAMVLVNDVDGEAAASVVDEIRRDGGVAFAAGASVEDGARIVDTALAQFDRIDIVINNAGTLRDAAFHKMARRDWDDVLGVHLTGAFEVTRAAWPHLRNQGWGRILLTSSIAGVHGNFGQANYATAKLGLFGLAQTLAIEGAGHDIRVNAIAPLAASRLTEGLWPAEVLERLAPEHVVPLVLLLASDACPVSGQLFEAGGGCFARLRWERSRRVELSSDGDSSPETLLRDWVTLQAFDGDDHPSSVADGFGLAVPADAGAGMAERVIVAGVGMTDFVAPSRSATYPALVAEAVCEALADAGLEFGDIGRAYAGYVYGDSASGQRALYGLGMTGIPVFNVNNNCASGSTALMLAREAVLSGVHECVLALGFEQMPSGAITEKYADRPGPLEPFAEAARRNHGESHAPLALRLFGGAARDYAARYGMSPECFASIAVKSRRHAAANPRAVFRTPLTIEEVLASPMLFAPLTRLQCCPPTCGAGAAVLVSDSFARRRGIPRGVTIAAQAMATDAGQSLNGDMVSVVGAGMSRAAARAVYSEAGIGPNDCQVIELHDCFTSNEVVSYEALDLVPPGDAGRMILDGDNTYGGRYVVNPSGGLLSKGHPLGATGLAQCYELVNQLRGRCGTRQVEGARLALQHNIGLGGACVVALYQKLDGA